MTVNRIDACFTDLQKSGKKALVAFCTADYPDKKNFTDFLQQAPQAGVDILEIGMPFSDPIADGPTIQLSNRVALQQRTNLDDIFSYITNWRKTNQTTPVVLMGYYNPVFKYGDQRFIDSCKQAGVDGLILVDLPPEESRDFYPVAQKADIAVIRLITPTTGVERMKLICQNASGFNYYVAVTGVTGVKKAEHSQVAQHIAQLRSASSLPVAVGFGISSPDDAKTMSANADAVVVGSALIRAIQAGGVAEGISFLQSLRAALDS